MIYTLLLLLMLSTPLCAQTYDSHLSFGGIGVDTTYGVAADAAGNTYACLHYDGAIDVAPAGGTPLTGFLAGAIVKYDNLRQVVWARQLTPVNAGDSVIPEMPAVDANGNVYVTGRFKGSVDFDPGVGAEVRTAMDTTGAAVTGWNAFALKLDAAGDLQWVNTFNGTETWGTRIVCNAARVAVVGLYNGTMDLDPAAGVQTATTAAGLYSTFYVMMDVAGVLIWGDANNGSALDMGVTPIITSTNELLVAIGYVVSVSIGQSGIATPTIGNADMLIVKFSTLGGLLWTRPVGSTGSNIVPASMAAAPGGYFYVAGQFRNATDFDPSAGVSWLTPQAGLDGFVARYDAAGDLEWARQFQSANDVTVAACAADAGGVVVSGGFNGAIDLDPSAGTQIHQSTQGLTFVARLDGNGLFQWGANFGAQVALGGSESAVYGMAMQGNGTIVLGGPYKGGADWDPGAGTVATTAVADRDGWLLWLDDAATAAPQLVLNAKTLPNLTEGALVNTTFTATGGTGSGYQWSVVAGQMPLGLTGVPGTGTPGVTVSGSPTNVGSYQFTLQVMDDSGETATRDFTWLIQAPYTPPPVETGSQRTSSGGGGCVAGESSSIWMLIAASLIAVLSVALRRRSLSRNCRV